MAVNAARESGPGGTAAPNRRPLRDNPVLILVWIALLLFALQTSGGPALLPPLPPSSLANRWRGRLIPFQARVTLRKVISQERVLAAAFQQDPVVLATEVNEHRQCQRQNIVDHNAKDTQDKHDHKTGKDGA